MTLQRAPLPVVCIYCGAAPLPRLTALGATSISAVAVNEHTHSPSTSVVSMDSSQVGPRVETRTLPIEPAELTTYPAVRSPVIGVRLGGHRYKERSTALNISLSFLGQQLGNTVEETYT